MKIRKEVVLLIVLIGLLFSINYTFLDGQVQKFLEDKETGFVGRIVDGDTAIINGNSTRFLGINTPEKGEKYYQEAKDALEKLILNKTVVLEYGAEKTDLYGRKLAFILLDEKNINIEQVRNGFANVYVLDDKRYETQLREAWEECIASGKNLCEKSTNKCAYCIELKELDIEDQEVIFYNRCNFDCSLENWTIKDEGRKKFKFRDFVLETDKEARIIVGNEIDSADSLYWEEEYVWTATGDTLFLRDDEGKLVLWEEIN